MNVSVVIPTYNRSRSLAQTLRALGEQTVPAEFRWELIVVDNNSSDDTRAVVDAARATCPVPLHYVFERRQGVSRARNAGIDHAKGAIVAFTDDDVTPSPDWVAEVDRSMHRWNADVVGGRILPRWSAPVPSWLAASPAAHDRLALMSHDTVVRLTLTMDKPCVWGANMAARRELLDSGHRFDPAWGSLGNKLYRGEDGYFIAGLLRTGHNVVYDPALWVWHRIPPERIRRAYFRRLSFQTGEGEGRFVTPSSRRRLFGAPLFSYRFAIAALASWLMAAVVRRQDAFDRELFFLEALGRLWARWTSYFSRGRGERA